MPNPPAVDELDEWLEGCRNQSSAGDKLTAALARLDADMAARLRAAIMQRREGSPKQWEYVADKLAPYIAEKSGLDITRSTIDNYRKRNGG